MFSSFQLTDMTFVFSSSGLIVFFVRTNVELHPDSESIPLLIDRVSVLIRCFTFPTSFSGSHTQSKLKCTNSLSGRFWRSMDFLSVCRHCQHFVSHDVSVLNDDGTSHQDAVLSAENEFRQLWTGFRGVLDRRDRAKDQAFRVSSTRRRAVCTGFAHAS